MWFKHERTSARTTVRKDSIHPPYTPIWGSGCSYARTGWGLWVGILGVLVLAGGAGGSWVLGAVPTRSHRLVRVQYVAGTLAGTARAEKKFVPPSSQLDLK